MHFRFLDIIVSLVGFVALLEKHNFLFASIASICTIIYWLYRFGNWIIKAIIKESNK
jgi:1,4-dihydroxy-2-naphthoate octaprenyltransferase